MKKLSLASTLFVLLFTSVTSQAQPILIESSQSASCVSQLDQLGISAYLDRNDCFEDPLYQSWVLGPEFISCLETTKKLGAKLRDASNFCIYKDNASTLPNLAANLDYKNCVSELSKIGFDSGVLNACNRFSGIWTDPTDQSTLKSCLTKSYQFGVASEFWAYERKSQNPEQQAKIFNATYDDCYRDTYSTPSFTKNISVIGFTAFHSSRGASWKEQYRNRYEKLGGISGCTLLPLDLQGKNNLLCVTDKPNSDFSFILEPILENNIGYFKLTSALPIQNPDKLDFEDVAALPDGKLLLTSEADLYYGFKSPREQYPHLIQLDQTGKFETYLPVEDRLIPRFGLSEVTRTRQVWENGIWTNHDYISQEMTQIAGVRENLAVESLSVDPTGVKLIYASEQGIAGLNPLEPFISFQSLTATEDPCPVTYRYPLDDLKEVGISAITALSPTEFLVLERSFDAIKDKANARIYKVSVLADHSDAEILLKKELLSDLGTLQSQLPAGFRKIDNFEAMTLGPVLPDGRRTLILASDNNFNERQKTLFVWLTF